MTITLDGTTGITTPGLTNTGTETIAALSVSGAVTLSGGTANGVGYLNGSKVLTTGTALTYNGTGLGIGVASASNPLHIDFDGTAARIVRGSAIGFVYNTGTTSTSSFRIQSNTGPVDIYTASGQPITFSAEAAEQMRLTSTGLGIGTSSPVTKLQVSGTNATLTLSDTNASGGSYSTLLFRNTDGLSTVYNIGSIYGLTTSNGGNGALTFYTAASNSNTEKMRIDSSGNLGIGTSSPATIGSGVPSITVNGNSVGYPNRSGGVIFRTQDSVQINYLYIEGYDMKYQLAGGGAQIWYTTNAERMRIDSSGNVGIGTSSPGAKLGVSDGSTALLQITPSGGVTLISSRNFANSSYVSAISDATQHIWRIAGTEAVRIDTSGNLLVGTTSATYGGQLTVRGAGVTVASFMNSNFVAATSGTQLNITAGATTGNTNFQMQVNSGGGLAYNDLVLQPSGGNLLVGTTSASLMGGKSLKIDGGTDTTAGQYSFLAYHNNQSYYFGLNNNGYVQSSAVYARTTASAANVNVDSSGYLTRSTSALKYKKDIRDLESVNVDLFRPVRYKSKCENDDQTKDHFGIVADEIAAAGIEELISRNELGEVEGFQYERLTVVLLKEIQSLRVRLNALESK